MSENQEEIEQEEEGSEEFEEEEDMKMSDYSPISSKMRHNRHTVTPFTEGGIRN